MMTKYAYVLGSVYSRYSLSKLSVVAVDVGVELLACCCSFASGNMPAQQASPPIVSQASAGNTLRNKKQTHTKSFYQIYI